MSKINKDAIKDSIPNAIPEHTKNLKINTRIVITSVLAIVIPLIIITLALTFYITNATSALDVSSSSNNFSLINQLQWNQVINRFAQNIADSKSEEQIAESLKASAADIEEIGALVYIEKNGQAIYETDGKDDIKDTAAKITDYETTRNSYYFSDKGSVIVSHAQAHDGEYLILIACEDYNVPDITADNAEKSVIGSFTLKTIIVLIAVILIFVIAIIIISLITSKTIVGPIEKITRGANEIANGNLDYEIDYSSTNELGQLADSFNEMRIRVKQSIEKQNKADQHSKEVMAGIAHDLRTPLTSVKGYLEGLRDGIADTPEKRERYLETIYSSTCSMEKMLNDLLTVSKLELGSITLDCEEVLISDFMAYADEVGKGLEKVDFDYEIIDNSKDNPKLYIDTDRFTRVIDNIISNSIKYKRPEAKGKIILSVSEYEHSVIFELADNGMGVDSESLPKIFDTLYRADKARSNVSDGNGLGLSVCKQIVELHGGMIWAQNNSMGGLSIFISLPKTEN